MKVLPSLLLTAAANAAIVVAGVASPTHQPLPHAKCIQTDKINEWHIVDSRTALVRTGPYRYVVHLKAACPRLGVGLPGLRLRANESNKAVGGGRICGEMGETVSSRDQPPCAISSVELIDKSRFEQLRKHALRHGSAVEPQPSR